MKYFAAVILAVITTFAAQSQTYEIGGFIGGANYIGDVGKTNYISPNTVAVGGILKWNRSPRHSFRATLIFADIEGDDAESEESRRNQRGYTFENKISEISVGIEYTFWDFSLYEGRHASTPYLYTGLTYFRQNSLYKRSDDEIVPYDKEGHLAIPMVVGYKTSVGTNVVVGLEIGARYAFTDNLDGSNPTKGFEDTQNLVFGNTDSDDWYVFTGLTFTFTFGRKPCYCNF